MRSRSGSRRGHGSKKNSYKKVIVEFVVSVLGIILATTLAVFVHKSDKKLEAVPKAEQEEYIKKRQEERDSEIIFSPTQRNFLIPIIVIIYGISLSMFVLSYKFVTVLVEKEVERGVEKEWEELKKWEKEPYSK